MRLGGPIFVQSDDPAELARAHRGAGYRAAYCPGIASLDAPDTILAVVDAFAASDVVIAEVGAWCNIIGPDEAERACNMQYVTSRLALADEVGARCCVDYAGTMADGPSPGPDPRDLGDEGFERVVQTVRAIIDAVKPRRTRFTLEMMPRVWPDGPEAYVELISAIDRPAFGVHLDPVNIITSPRRFMDTGGVIRECFRLLGSHVVSCHAKDIRATGLFPVGLEECPPGEGVLDYAAFLTELGKLPAEMPLMLEHLQTEAQYDRARDYIVSVATANGPRF